MLKLITASSMQANMRELALRHEADLKRLRRKLKLSHGVRMEVAGVHAEAPELQQPVQSGHEH